MRTFQASVHARGTRPLAHGEALLDGRRLATIDPNNEQQRTPLIVTWDEAAAALEQLPRMLLEPDGSWVWHGEDGGRTWQLDGQLVEHDRRLLAVDVHGTCSPAALDQLLACLGWPDEPVLFCLRHQGVWLEETEFRRWVFSDD